jgi:hypothetical protein
MSVSRGLGLTAFVVLATALLLAPVMARTDGPVNGRVTVNPLAASLVLTSGDVRQGDRLVAVGVARNAASYALQSVRLTLRTPTGLIIDGSATHELGSLDAGSSRATSWRLCAAVPGTYVILVTANATGNGIAFQTDSDAQTLLVRASKRSCR